MIFTWRVFSCYFKRYHVIKLFLVREIVNLNVGESREKANWNGGFRDYFTK
jgi:hypothetical protein